MEERTHSGASLFLMEFMVMLLVFFVSCAIILSVFASAHGYTRRSQDLSGAMIQAQSLAEQLKNAGDYETMTDRFGDLEAGVTLWYDRDWRQVEGEGAYQAKITLRAGCPVEGNIVIGGEEGELYALPFALAEGVER
ncbi:hypothetical protein [Gehongia tenuis]|uniref:Uncharacterized protein n=1 Tax=Gehongia tenuis TaxID=2763655 RepID=A0A926D605_9FIRM|nr:hypothetical protein [Gehongia tenuis]MBC8532018.1 hypothetical protein [Gehongia tenuis]